MTKERTKLFHIIKTAEHIKTLALRSVPGDMDTWVDMSIYVKQRSIATSKRAKRTGLL